MPSSIPDTSPVVPNHVAIIMDGNGRWATARGLPRIAGHRKGVEAVKETVKAAAEMGVRHLTLYAFSSENWRRSVEEVSDLLGLLRYYLKSYLADLHKENVRLRVIGERERLPQDIATMIENAERLTVSNTGLGLTIALSYGGRQEIGDAMRRIAVDVAAGRLQPANITEDTVESYLFTAGLPDPDLMIRTSGEQRISNFLLWQMAYTELVFTKTLWPDFTRQDLEQAILEFNQRERRFGAVKATQ